MASFDASFMQMCWTAASAPPGVLPLRMRMSPMWLTSNTPTPPRTALCSAIRPPLEGYSTGISQPPKLTIFAPSLRCSALSGVLRSSIVVGEVADSIPLAQAGTDTSTRPMVRQRSSNVKSGMPGRGAQIKTGFRAWILMLWYGHLLDRAETACRRDSWNMDTPDRQRLGDLWLECW